MAKQIKILPFVGYVRVSSEDQARSGLSLEAQESKVRAMATVKGVELADVVIDAAESGKSLDRPGMRRVMEMMKRREVAGVIVAKLDRLSRRVADFGELLELIEGCGAVLVSAVETVDTSTAAGRMCLNVSMSFAQFEREVICERTKDALQAKLKRGEACGNVQYGFERAEDGKAIRYEPEQRILAVIRLRRAAGMSFGKIAAWLNDRGEVTRSGSQWRAQYVDSVLRRMEQI